MLAPIAETPHVDSLRVFCKGNAHLDECGEPMKLRTQKQRLSLTVETWKCMATTCRSTRSVRKWNGLFHHVDATGRTASWLSLCNIMHLLYSFPYSKSTLRELIVKTGHSSETVIDWIACSRETCSKALYDFIPPLNGTAAFPVQIYETYFQGRRKYRRGRLLDGDTKPKGDSALLEIERIE